MLSVNPVAASMFASWIVDIAQLPFDETQPALHIATIDARSYLPLKYAIEVNGYDAQVC